MAAEVWTFGTAGRSARRTKDGRTRDNQKQRLYDAEEIAHCEHGTPWMQTIANDQLQSFVDSVLAKAAVQSRWGQRRITVELTHGGGRANHWGTQIRLGKDARNEWVILHEMAHCLVPSQYAWHGPEFAGVLVFLVQTVLGKAQADSLRAAFRQKRVRKNTKAIPAPTRTVVTKSQRAAKVKAATNRPVTKAELSEAADIIRRAAKQGLLGESTRKPRVHALATARLLEGAK